MKEFTIVRGLFDTRKRQLIIDEEFLKFENKDHTDDLFTIIPKNEIAGIRYGIHFIRGFEFYVGREYQIFIKTNLGKELKISFKLFYGRKLDKKHQLFCDIIDELWNCYFDDILNKYIRQYNNNEEFNLGGILFRDTCIEFDNKEISYSDLGIKKYNHYLIIYSKEDQYKNKMLYFLKDENAVLISSLISLISKNAVN
ncbi:hypothetical protein [Chryseobacterium luquanense]|uniref:Uncharacterized protein n=1 Tax=Chryseobacterium luquanense TaxID=2983766 RepID=A0ABT3Y303_9FLAO|nr:hypothetical protein [Chryseobacterium luquanense]MCX8532518.1 hypothetical protein [Chryseobacterium luquanense]